MIENKKALITKKIHDTYDKHIEQA